MHVFLLLVYLGVGDDRVLISNDMYFRSILNCNFYASEVSKRYGNFQYHDWMDNRDRVTAYCVPKYIKSGSVEVY
jgi:hypothetical protein